MNNKHSRAPLYEAIVKHVGSKPASFHTPGHCGRGLPEEFLSLGHKLLEMDLTEINGLDDLSQPRGPIAEAQELAAALYGADNTFFLVNGSTTGLQALLTAVAGAREVIVPRNAHRSVLGGLIIAGADPVYAEPEIIPGFGLDCGVSPVKIRQLLNQHPSAAAVMAVYPNYYGIAGDLKGQAEAAHRADRPLLVDEAHGPHLRFRQGLPQDAMAAGADACVQSTHKLGGSLTQSSMLHLGGSMVQAEKVSAALRLLNTTSPSYLLMASLDLARRQLALKGEELLAGALELARQVREQLSQVNGLRVLQAEHLPGAPHRLDPSKLVVSVREIGLSGYQVAGLLAERYGVFVEMADSVHVVAFISIGTVRGDCDALVYALKDIAARDRQPAGPALPPIMTAGYKKRMKPRDAWFSPAQRVFLKEAVGRIAAESVAVCPPGIPAVNPGEELTGEVIEYITELSRLGLTCHGPSDPSLKTLKVVIE